MKLTTMKYEAFAKLASEIDSRIDRACNLYNSLLKESGAPMRDEDILHNGVTYLDELYGGIDIDWETTWSYGGHARGSCYISMEELLDDTWEEAITKRAKAVIRKHRSNESSKKRAKTKAERDEYERLRKQFE